jgi:hypothetical protein
MTTSEIARTYPSLDAFYSADARRRHSRERDIGLFWRSVDGTSFRAAWVQETGEVYLYRHGHPMEGGGTVDLLVRRFGLGDLQSTINGYREIVGRRGSLAWFFDRIGGRPAAAA